MVDQFAIRDENCLTRRRNKGPLFGVGVLLSAFSIFALCVRWAKDLPISGHIGSILAINIVALSLCNFSYFFYRNRELNYDQSKIIAKLNPLIGPKTYFINDLQAIRIYCLVRTSDLPLNGIILDFPQNSELLLRTSDWAMESLQKFVRDLVVLRPDLYRNQTLMDYAAGHFDDRFQSAGF